jgi:hypothetical protein
MDLKVGILLSSVGPVTALPRNHFAARYRRPQSPGNRPWQVILKLHESGMNSSFEADRAQFRQF